MPYVTNHGTKIHYKVEGHGQSLMMVHSLFGSMRTWRTYGYSEELKKDYQLIMLDIRGHGQSNKPTELEAYTPKILAEDIIAIMDELGIKKTNYLGYSLGSMIGFMGIARYYLPRINSLILGGYPAYGDEEFDQFEEGLTTLLQEGSEKGIGASITKLEKMAGTAFPRNQKYYLLSLNPKLLANFILAARKDYSESVFDGILAGIDIPCLIYAGENCPSVAAMKKTAGKIPNAIFVSFPGLNHFTALSRSDLVLPPIKEFLVEAHKR